MQFLTISMAVRISISSIHPKYNIQVLIVLILWINIERVVSFPFWRDWSSQRVVSFLMGLDCLGLCLLSAGGSLESLV